jgi:hypothetical protein
MCATAANRRRLTTPTSSWRFLESSSLGQIDIPPWSDTLSKAWHPEQLHPYYIRSQLTEISHQMAWCHMTPADFNLLSISCARLACLNQAQLSDSSGAT